MSGIIGGNLGRGSGLIKAGAVDDNSVTLAKMAGLARGNLIYGDTSGDPAALAVGGADEVLTHDGTDFDWAAGGGDLSFGGDTFGADKTIGSNDTYALSFETDGNEAMKIDTAGIITKPLQPSFMTNVGTKMDSLGSSDTTVEFDTETWDINGDFNTGTYTFTAPVTGKYYLVIQLQPHGLSADIATIGAKLQTSNRLWNYSWEPAKFAEAEFTTEMGFSVVGDMDAADTAYVQIYLSTAVGGDRDLHPPTYSNLFGGYLLG